MAVSCTSTINTEFGSKVMDEKTGVLFNNQMDDFSIPNILNSFGLAPGRNNDMFPGRRPRSSMSPVIITDGGRLEAVLGGSGGSRIITSVLMVCLSMP